MTTAELTLERLEKEFAQADTKGSEGKRPPLTIRTIDEILNMRFDDTDLVLSNAYLARGESTAICGMGGVDDDFDLEAWQQSLESPHGRAAKLGVEMVLNLLPPTGSIPKIMVIERLRDKGIGEKRSRAFISTILAPAGPVHEWRMKRPSKRDEVHLSRESQPGTES
jgi:hypothetical protein